VEREKQATYPLRRALKNRDWLDQRGGIAAALIHLIRTVGLEPDKQSSSRNDLLADLHHRCGNRIQLAEATASRSGGHTKTGVGDPVVFNHIGQTLGTGL
jgi:hypothetical protein